MNIYICIYDDPSVLIYSENLVRHAANSGSFKYIVLLQRSTQVSKHDTKAHKIVNMRYISPHQTKYTPSVALALRTLAQGFDVDTSRYTGGADHRQQSVSQGTQSTQGADCRKILRIPGCLGYRLPKNTQYSRATRASAVENIRYAGYRRLT